MFYSYLKYCGGQWFPIMINGFRDDKKISNAEFSFILQLFFGRFNNTLKK